MKLGDFGPLGKDKFQADGEELIELAFEPNHANLMNSDWIRCRITV